MKGAVVDGSVSQGSHFKSLDVSSDAIADESLGVGVVLYSSF